MDVYAPVLTDDEIEYADVLASSISSRKIIRFIREHTNIPVPKVLNCYKKDGMGYILMDFIEGEMLNNAWPKLSPEAKNTILTELSNYIRQMRQIPARSDNMIGSVTGGPAVDQRSMGPIKGGPFKSEEAFNDWQLDQILPGIPLSNRDMYHAMHRADHAIVFSHGDLGFHNVLVQNGHVVAIIDWESAGWMPEHWDYCKSARHISGSDDLYLALKRLYETSTFLKPYWI
ncbi:kinase-like protein [Pyrenochaeta sp. DS3sAY3a]|nr:kinase-like protein [Pyrenochaeta sp. DS3sAY3a]